jgi:hypothetical protein
VQGFYHAPPGAATSDMNPQAPALSAKWPSIVDRTNC